MEVQEKHLPVERGVYVQGQSIHVNQEFRSEDPLSTESDVFHVSNKAAGIFSVTEVTDILSQSKTPASHLGPVQQFDAAISNKMVQSFEQDYGLNLSFPAAQAPFNESQTYNESLGSNPGSLVIPSTATGQSYTQSGAVIMPVAGPTLQQPHTFTPDKFSEKLSEKLSGDVLPATIDNSIGNALPKTNPEAPVYFGTVPPNSTAEHSDQIDDVCAAVGINQSSNLVDFFSSLELQSRWVGDIGRGQASEAEDRLDHQKALRIASILNDLAFNSDTEDFLPSDTDDLWTSDLEDAAIDLESESKGGRGCTPHHPGKWRPGQAPLGKKRGKGQPQSGGKWKPSGKLVAMRKAKTAKPQVKSRGKRMSAKLKAMKKARGLDLVEKDREVKWKPGERLRDRSSFRKVWMEDKRSPRKGKEAKVEGPVKEPTKSSRETLKRGARDTREDLPPEMREEEESEEEEEVVPLDFICHTCDLKLSSQGHFMRHLKSREHKKRTAMTATSEVCSSMGSAPVLVSASTDTAASMDTMRAESSYEDGVDVVPENVAVTVEVFDESVDESVDTIIDPSTNRRSPSAFDMNESRSILRVNKRASEDILEKKSAKAAEVECTICVKTFPSKYLFARHLSTNSHLYRASVCPRKLLLDESVQVLLLRQSRMQCLVCSFFGMHREILVKHMRTRDHTERVEALIGPLLCVRCKFASKSNEDMLEHLQTQAHEQVVQASGRPCIVKESRSKIPCPNCHAIMSSATRLKSHLKSCTGSQKERGQKREPLCTYCGRMFSTLYAMTIHVRRKHTKERPYRCEWCDVAFTDRHSLGVHQLSISHLEHTAIVMPPLGSDNEQQMKKKEGKSKRYKCRHCPFTAKVYSALRPHYYTHHASQLECEACKEKFSSAKEMKEHNRTLKHRKKTNAQNEKFHCRDCGKVCKDEKGLKFHELSHTHPVSEKQLAKEQPAGIVAGISSKHLDFIESIKSMPPVQKVQCPECAQWTPRTRIYAHLRRHEGVRLFQCPYCPKNLASANTLRQHIHAHLQVKSHSCAKCDKSFPSATKLKEHINENHEVSPEPLAACNQCGEQFMSSRHLYKHQLTHISAFKCTVAGCFYTTKYKYDLRVHMKTHSTEKDFLCNLCGFAAKRKGGLLEHMKSHTGQRRFTCEYCDYKAKTGAHLRRHMRIHIGAKPFNCPYCSYKCRSLDNLHKHIQATKIHSGLPVYPCKICEFGTNTSREFKNHVIGVHKIDGAQIRKKLASYCGIYDKTSDPKDIPEGACALPVREVKQKLTIDKSMIHNDHNEAQTVKAPRKRTRTTKKPKRQKLKPEAKQFETETLQRLMEDTAQLADSSVQLADSSEQLADSSEQLADSSEQLADSSEQLVDSSEKLADSSEQLADSSEQLADQLTIVSSTCDDNMESSIILTIPSAQYEVPQMDLQDEVQDCGQVFPDIQALLHHLTQQQTVLPSVPDPGQDLDIQGQVEVPHDVIH